MADETFISFPNHVNNACSGGIGGMIFSTVFSDTTIKPANLWFRGVPNECGSGPLFHATRSAEYTYSSVGAASVDIIFNRWITVNDSPRNLVQINCTGSEIFIARWDSGRCKVGRYDNPRASTEGDQRRCFCNLRMTSWFSSSVPKGHPGELWAAESWRLRNVSSVSQSWTAKGDPVSYYYYWPISSVPSGSAASFKFELDELNFWNSRIIGLPMSSKLVPVFASAFYDAFDKIPEASCNSIANLLEIASTLAKLFRGDFSSLMELSGSALWLQYRYVVTTTRLDIAEYRSLTQRLIALSGVDTIKCYGQVTDRYGIYRCTIELDADQFLPRDTISALEAFGFQLSLVNAWDMIPYSFVVDWFLHIGSLLENLEKAVQAREYSYRNIWYTAKLQYGSPLQSVFLRFRGTKPPQPAFFSVKEVGSKTLLMRLTDALCLIAQKGD